MPLGMDEWLNIYLDQLRAENEKENPSSAIVSMYSEAIGRCYILQGKHMEANMYFKMASEAYLDDLERGTGLTKTANRGRGDDRLTCGRIMWRVGDDRAEALFRDAIQEYDKVLSDMSEYEQIISLERKSYCHLFLDEYEEAKKAIQESVDKALKFGKSFPDDPSEVLLDSIESLQNGERDAIEEASSKFRQYLKVNRIMLFGMNLPHIVDVYELVNRKAQQENYSKA